AAAALTLRAAETASRRWLAAAGAMVGLGFLAKMLQAFVLLPSLLVGYAVAAPAPWRKKVVDLVVASAAMVAAFGWWIAIVELVPASWRPYVGGSQTNSVLELTFGYNGLGRLNGNETGSVGGGPGGAGGRWGQTGIGRMFTTVSGEMVSWLIPAALLLAVIGFVLLGRRAWATTLRAGTETSQTRTAGALALFGSWLVVTAAVFSFMAGIYHDYYTVALAPAIGGTVAVGGAVAWAHRDRLLARGGLAAAALVSAAWGVALATVPGGTYLVVSVAAAVVLVLAAVALLVRPARAAVSTVALALAVAGLLAGPAAYSVNTMLTPHTGSIVTAGPARSGLSGEQSGPGGRGPGEGTDRRRDRGAPGPVPGEDPAGQNGQAPGPDGQGQASRGQNGQAPGPDGQAPGGQPQAGADGQPSPGSGEGPGQGGPGGLLGGTRVSQEMVTLLSADADRYTWVAATTGAQNAASYQLGTGHAVMAIGGFNGSDPYPTLEQFQRYVADGRVHYFISGSLGGPQGAGGTSAQISSWVAETYTATTVGSVTVYDLT
ncbi:MAG: glycosyltransferase family 39 protein, partial [Actinomycetia bacterium]|nr:glycosyltransferase family 39 protein [Actinomycetes bacterium]